MSHLRGYESNSCSFGRSRNYPLASLSQQRDVGFVIKILICWQREEVTTVKGRIVSYLLLSGSLGTWSALTVLFHSSWSDGWNVLLRTKSIKGIIGTRWIRGHERRYVTRNGWYCTSQLLMKSRCWYQHEYFIPFCFCFDPWAVSSKVGQGSLPSVFWDSMGPSTTPDSEHPQSLTGVPT